MPKMRNYMKKRRKSNRKDKSSISIGRVESLIFQIMNRGLFIIRSSEGEQLVVAGAEARRLGYNLNCFEVCDGMIEGHSFVDRTSQPRAVVRKLEELEKFKAVIDFGGALHPNESSKGVFAPSEEEKELHWDPRKKGRSGRMGGPRGRVSKMNKLGLNGTKPGKSRNQGHTTCPNDSKGWISRKEAERNGGVAASKGRRVKSSGHHAHTQRSKAAAAATIRMERKIQQVNAESKEAVVDAKGLNKKLQADQEKRAKAEAQKAARVEVNTDDLAIDTMFAPAQKKE